MPDLFARYRVLRVLVSLVTVVVAIYATRLVWATLVTFGDIILLFFLAWVIAFILEPLSMALRRRGIPRPIAVSLIYIALALVLTGAIVLTVPLVGDQVRRLGTELSSAMSPDNVTQVSTNVVSALTRLGVRQRDAERIVSQLRSEIPTYISSASNQAVSIATSTITSVLNLLLDTFLVIILSFYMMLDGERLIAGIVTRLPPKWVDDARMFRGYVSQIFGGFLRAQVLVALIYAAFTWIALLALGQANSIPVALICGALMMLPFIGTVLAVIPPIALVLLQTPNDQLAGKLVILLIALIISQQITLQIIAPRVFGATMGVHPLLLFAGLLIGAKVSGVWGAFFAGPIVAVAYAMFEVFYDRYRESSPRFPNFPPRDEADGACHANDTDLAPASQRPERPATVAAPGGPAAASVESTAPQR